MTKNISKKIYVVKVLPEDSNADLDSAFCTSFKKAMEIAKNIEGELSKSGR